MNYQKNLRYRCLLIKIWLIVRIVFIKINNLERFCCFFRCFHLLLDRISSQPSLLIQRLIGFRVFLNRWHSCIRCRMWHRGLWISPKVDCFFGVFLKRFEQWQIEFRYIGSIHRVCLTFFRFKRLIWQKWHRVFLFGRWRQRRLQHQRWQSRCTLLGYFLSRSRVIGQLFRGLIHRVIFLWRRVGRGRIKLGHIGG